MNDLNSKLYHLFPPDRVPYVNMYTIVYMLVYLHYYSENTHTFEEFDLIQGSLSVVRGALHHFQGTEASGPKVETIPKSHFTSKVKMPFTIQKM